MVEQLLSASPSRNALMALSQAGDVAKFLTLADRTLAEVPDDVDLRMLLVRRLAEQGLLHRAAQTAEGFPPAMQANAEFADLLHQLRSPHNNGLASWQRLASRFAANIASLRKRYDWADDVAAVWQAEHGHLELHRTTTHLWQVFDRRPGNTGGWRPCFGDLRPRETIDEIAAHVANTLLSPILIDGLDLGYALPHMRAATRNTFLGACPVIIQIEPCLLALAVALHLNDWRDAITDERVRLYVGDDAYDRFARDLEADPWLAVPQTVSRTVPWNPDTVGIAERHLAEITQRSEARLADIRDRISSQYRDRDGTYWRHRYAKALSGEGPPLRILGLTSRFTTVLQYSMRDALRAFAARGCETRLLIERNNHSILTPLKKIETIQEFQPDLVFIIDHTRASQAVGMVPDLPVLTWVQDRLPWLFDQATGQAMGPLDFCMGFARRELVENCGYPADRFFECDMATDPAVFYPHDEEDSEGGGLWQPGQDREPDDARFDCDVAYATHASQTPAELHEDCLRLSEGGEVRRLIDAIYDELVSLTRRCQLNGALQFDVFLARMERATALEVAADRRNDLIANFIRPMVDRLLRHQTIAWTANWADATGRCFHLYGAGWDKHPRYGKHARGKIEHGLELGRAFRRAAVNLHAGCNTGLHQRVLDGLSAGGFFLIRRHAIDIRYRVSCAIYELVKRNGFRPGTTMTWKDLPSPLDEEFVALRRMQGMDPHTPVVFADEESFRNLRAVHEERSLVLASALWPEFENITFGTEGELVDRLEWYLANAEERNAIAASMRDRSLERFGYKTLMGKVLSWMVDTLGQPDGEARPTR
ncbi:MAG: glycosyltransferase family 1 protein [Phycisphaerae bacterium]|nr:glycosyltransferase family 1 protein [Phycisphaerae bacterium]